MRRTLAIVAVFLLALALRVAPIEHGMPRGYVPDGHMVRNALGMAQDKDLVPPAGKYSTYPYLVPYALLPIYAAEYVAGRASGEWKGSGEFANRAKEQPGVVILPARALMALCGALTCWAVFRAARAAKLTVGAWVAAWLAATCLLSVQLSTHERPWSAVVLFGALSAWSSIVYGDSGRRRDLLLACSAAAGAFACHQAGLVFLGVPVAAWYSSALGGGWPKLRARLPQAALGVAVFVAVAVVVGHPYFLRYGLTPNEAVIGGGQHFAIGGQPVRLGVSLASAAHLLPKWFGYDPVLLVLGACGFVLALRHRMLSAVAIATFVIAGFFLFNPNDHVRYLLPASVLLTLPAGLFAERVWSSRPARAVLLVAFALPLVQALRLDQLLLREDTRAECERLLATLPPGSTIAIDHYGPLPEKSRTALERIAKLRELYGREAHRMQYFEANVEPPGGPGIDAIGVEELFGVDAKTLEYGVHDDPKVRALGSTPSEVLTQLGVDYLVLAERNPGRETRPLAALVAGRSPLQVIDPARRGSTCDEAFLPTEMDFPLTALWCATRPGPRLELYRLEP